MQALLAMDYRPVPLSGRADQKVVDIGIQRTLDALVDRDADVFLCSHDGDFVAADARRCSAAAPGRAHRAARVRQHAVPALGVPIHDLEDDVRAFKVPLPRVRVIPLDEFDPEYFLR